MEKSNKKVKKEEELELYPISIKESFYANGIGYQWREDEVYLEFFQTPEMHDKTYAGIRIYILPGFVKDLKNVLEEIIKDYEKKFGKLK